MNPSLLMWEKPEQILSKDQWMAISADGAPPGVWSSNMSDADMHRYKAKLVGTTKGEPRIEIRKTFSGTQVLILVTLLENGLCIGKHKTEANPHWRIYDIHPGKHIRISMNGPIHISFDELSELRQAVEEAAEVLRTI